MEMLLQQVKESTLNQVQFHQRWLQKEIQGGQAKSYQFVIRLKNYLAKRLELSGSSSGDFEEIVDLIVKEQFINACSEELAVYLLERGPNDLVELTTWAQQYLIVYKQQLEEARPSLQSSLNVPNKENTV